MLDWNGLFLTSGVGTTIYASPEQLAGVEYGPKVSFCNINKFHLKVNEPDFS